MGTGDVTEPYSIEALEPIPAEMRFWTNAELASGRLR